MAEDLGEHCRQLAEALAQPEAGAATQPPVHRVVRPPARTRSTGRADHGRRDRARRRAREAAAPGTVVARPARRALLAALKRRAIVRTDLRSRETGFPATFRGTPRPQVCRPTPTAGDESLRARQSGSSFGLPIDRADPPTPGRQYRSCATTTAGGGRHAAPPDRAPRRASPRHVFIRALFGRHPRRMACPERSRGARSREHHIQRLRRVGRSLRHLVAEPGRQARQRRLRERMQMRQEHQHAHRRLAFLVRDRDDEVRARLLSFCCGGEDAVRVVGVLQRVEGEDQSERAAAAKGVLRLWRFERKSSRTQPGADAVISARWRDASMPTSLVKPAAVSSWRLVPYPQPISQTGSVRSNGSPCARPTVA